MYKENQVCKGFAKRIKTNSQAPEHSNIKKVKQGIENDETSM